MNRFKRLILLCACCLFAAVSLCACSGAGKSWSEGVSESDEQYMIQVAEQIFQSVVEISGSDYVKEAEKIPLFKKALTSYQGSAEDIGEFDPSQPFSETITRTDENEYEVSFDVKGSEHDATVVTIFREEWNQNQGNFILDPVSVTTNVDYSFGELMGQAALNTLLGMGITFGVLILLCFVISQFGRIHKYQEMREEEERMLAELKKPLVVEALEPIPETFTPEELSLRAKAAGLEEEPAEEVPADMTLIAVIAAAIAAYEGKPSPDELVVRSIRRAGRSRGRAR